MIIQSSREFSSDKFFLKITEYEFCVVVRAPKCHGEVALWYRDCVA
jgi:hypothetical protein